MSEYARLLNQLLCIERTQELKIVASQQGRDSLPALSGFLWVLLLLQSPKNTHFVKRLRSVVLRCTTCNDASTVFVSLYFAQISPVKVQYLGVVVRNIRG